MGTQLLSEKSAKRISRETGLEVLRAATLGNEWRDLAVRSGKGHYHVLYNRITGEIEETYQGGWSSCLTFGPHVDGETSFTTKGKR